MAFPTTIPSSLEIARAAKLRPIEEVTDSIGSQPDVVEIHGRHTAKLHVGVTETGRPVGVR